MLYLITDGGRLRTASTSPQIATKKLSNFIQIITTCLEAGDGLISYLQIREQVFGSKYPKSSDQEVLEILHELRAITKKFSCKLIVNNRTDLAIVGKADGVHLGRNSISSKDALRIIQSPSPTHKKNIEKNKTFEIGYSAHLDFAFKGQEIPTPPSNTNHSITNSTTSFETKDERKEISAADNFFENQSDFSYCLISPVFPTSSKPKGTPHLGLTTLKEFKSKVAIPVYALGGINCDNLESCLDTGIQGVAILSEIFSSENPALSTGQIISRIKSYKK